MRISVTCPSQSGVSLPELLVVITIISLSLSLVIPNVTGLYDRLEVFLNREEVIELFDNLGLEAQRGGFRIDEGSFKQGGKLVDYFPSGWSLNGRFIFFSNGACQGGEISIAFNTQDVISALVAPPFCRIKDVE